MTIIHTIITDYIPNKTIWHIKTRNVQIAAYFGSLFWILFVKFLYAWLCLKAFGHNLRNASDRLDTLQKISWIVLRQTKLNDNY